MEYQLTDLIDKDFLQRLTDLYYGMTGVATGNLHPEGRDDLKWHID